ncbi:MAG: helicase domain protein, partial [Pseudonocardia sp.]|nr:helicase domain protein [Pseudonocardia sp.]
SLAQSVLEQRPIKIFDEPEPGMRIPNLTETVAAQEKASELNERFADWVWADPDRAASLARLYNDTFNAIVLRNYDGAHRQFPGLAVTIELREHQVAAVVRMLSEPTVLLAHEVGAGKTLEMIVGCMELRRLGMAQKPAVVVPNHMLEQFSREWMQAYPQARILAASTEDLTRDRRRLFVARVATGDWDAVILSRSAFERLPLSPDAQRAYLDGQLSDLRRQLENSKSAGGLTVKRLQGTLQRAEERLKKITDTERDPAITFEHSGIDYLAIDEAHGFKNLRLASNIPGVAIEGSQRASDLDMKLSHLRERHGARTACFATATPIANSIAEAYVMQRYLRPDVLDAAGLTDFDVWAATFGEVTTDLELSPDGSRYRMQSRFAKFRNVPELLRMWHLSADIKTAEDLDLPTPAITGGKAETVVVPASPELTEFMRTLAARADQVQAKAVDPKEDNMLRVATHGRMAALDLRLLPHNLIDFAHQVTEKASEGPKLDIVADRIALIHHHRANQRYDNSPTAGALQLVFCDLGTPSSAGWNAYRELRGLLADRGVPAESVRFMHEARNDREKCEMFAAARSGRIAVLVGSTEKMGVGTNVQARAIALHHVDCPWRPADLAQRDGRILRQGNLNDEVEILRYVTEGSFDGYLWQTVERKARFIAQVMRGRLDVREIEDIGDTALSYAEVKALASGDPRILEKARVDSETTRLERLHRAWSRNQHTLDATISSADRRLPTLAADLDRLDDALTQRRDTRGDAFAITVGQRRHDSRADAASALRNTLATIDPLYRDVEARVVAHIGGFDVLAAGQRLLEPHLRLELAGVPRSGFTLGLDEVRPDRPIGIITKLENRVAAISQLRAEVEQEIHRSTTERDRAAAELGQPFPHAAALATSRARETELAAELAEQASRTTGTPGAENHNAAPAAGGPVAHPGNSNHAAGNPPSESASATPAARTAGSRGFAVHDMNDGRFLAVKNGSGVGPAHLTRPQADAYVAALNDGASHDEANLAAFRADPTGYTQGGEPVTDARTDRSGDRGHDPQTAEPAPTPPATVFDQPPPGGWTAADRVPTEGPQPDTTSWPSARRYPLGTELTVHAIGSDGPGRSLGHGVVIDHPGPEHVTVESPYGTRRVAPISHVSPNGAPPQGPDPARAPTNPAATERPEPPEQRWRAHALALDEGQRIVDDPSWPRLAAVIEQAHAADYDVATQLPHLAGGQPLDERRPAADLLYRLANDCPAAQTPLPPHGYRTGDTPPRPPQQMPTIGDMTREPPRR